jgi:hypothetical protein
VPGEAGGTGIPMKKRTPPGPEVTEVEELPLIVSPFSNM